MSQLPGWGTNSSRRSSTTEAWEMITGLLEATRLMPATLRAPEGSLPLTILSGFLGAGKTTLLNRLLTEPGGRRIAVLVNDFGRINIDAALIRSQTEDMISLTNGCACCTVSGDLTRTLIELAQRAEPPQAIVLEASGLADPCGIAQVALSNPALRLDGVLTLVDAVACSEMAGAADLWQTIDRQLDAADLIVLTKTDEASPEQQQAARTLLDARQPGKPVVIAVRGELPADVVLGVHSTRDPRQLPRSPWDHGERFESVSLQSTVPLDGERLAPFLNALPPELLRAKGVLWIAQDPARRQVYQRVGHRSSLVPEDGWAGVNPSSSLVLIGHAGRMDALALRRDFNQLKATQPRTPTSLD